MKVRRLIQSYIFLHVILFMASISLAGTGFEVGLSENNSENIELNFKLSEYTIDTTTENGTDFSVIDFEGGVTLNEKGYAELPFLSAAVELGENGDVIAEVVDSTYVDIDLDFALLPSRGVIYRNENPGDIPFVIDPKSIVDEWYPNNLVKTTKPFIFRDIRGSSVFVYPFQYNAKHQILRIYDNIKVRLSYDLTKSTNALSDSANSTRIITSEMNSIYSDLFVNYNENQTRFPNEVGEVGDILVIHTSRDKSAIAPYVQWKLQKGFNVTTKEVNSGTNVKSIIKNAYDTNKNLLYVQLVGDWEDIKSDLGTGENAPMDPMLGCVVGSDNYPDLIIGRFSAKNAGHVTTQVNKTINYEKSPDMNGTWYSTGLGIGSNDGAGKGDDGEIDWQHMDIIKKNKLMPFTYSKVHEVYKSGNASTVGGHINSGLSIINYVGHGSETSFVTSGFSNSDIDKLNNGNKLPFIFSVACVNGKFHRRIGDSFAESWLKKENGGAVATLMSTINQPWQPPMRGQDYMNDLLVGGYDYGKNPGKGTNVTEGRTSFGSIAFNGFVLMFAESSGNADLETIQTWTIFGDSSLQVRTSKPKAISMSNKSVSSGQAFSTTITSGQAVEGAMVALSQGSAVFSALTDSSGKATLNHSFTSGEATLVVSGFNLETKYQKVTVGGGGNNKKPIADFSSTPNNLKVTFSNSSTDPDGTITNYAWDFGDNSGTSSRKNPVYNYGAAGTYRVKLTVTDNDGATGSTSKNVTVGSGPNPSKGAFDGFESYGWKGGNGWMGPWKKTGDVKKIQAKPYKGKKYARLRAKSGYLQRAVDITGASSITLRFAGRIRSFEKGDMAIVKAGTDVNNLKDFLTFSVEHSDNTYKVHEANLSEYANKGNTKLFIVFDAEMSKKKDYWYIDDVEVILGK